MLRQLVLISASVIMAAGQSSPNSPEATFTKYCVTCHNARLKTAGFVLDTADLKNVGGHAETWEKVVRKLRTEAMPPAGAPRPDRATYDSTAAYLEAELDRAAAARPNPGSLPLLHRLTRTEYQNAIRDLLAVDALPKEMDYSLLLPADNASSGFDNIADLLFVSPTSMERYLDAAAKISRLAIGDPATPEMVNIYRLSDELTQDVRLDDLPFGTRGGAAVRSDFPVDGEYAVKVEFANSSRDQNQLLITSDGRRVVLETLGGQAGRGSEKTREFRIPLKAGPQLIGVTFIQRDETRDEQTLRPRMRGRGTQLAMSSVTISGPYNVSGSGDSPSRRRIFVCHDENDTCARKILSTLAQRAYRRPLTDADLQYLLPFYTAGRGEGGNFEAGIQRALERLLVSPQFLFRVEHNAEGSAPQRISDLELASRLSFFLWSSIPDDELLARAARGELKDPAVLDSEIHRMLADDRSQSMVTNFAEQWLFLRDIEAKQPDELLFPDFDDSLRQAFRKETDLFLNAVLRENRSVVELLTANFTFVNERLAKHYGIPNVEGSYFRRVTLPEGSVRGGLLGQGSLLTLTSYSTRTSPVVRGKWVLENLLSAPPPPPPPNIPALKTEASETGKPLSMRDAMLQHRANPACAGCHARMDPIGFAMENFDAVGRWRDTDAGGAIDTSGVFPDGTKFDGMAGLKQVLVGHPEQFVSTIAEKLLMYGLGRNLQYYDAPAVRTIVRSAAAKNYSFEALVAGVVRSPAFQMRAPQAASKVATAKLQ
jgi:cytochrome c551/c552